MSRPTLQQRIEDAGWLFAYAVIAFTVGLSFYGAFVAGW